MSFWISETLRRIRLKMGETQSGMAELSGLGQSKVSQLENGRSNVELSTLQALAAASDAEVVIVPRALLPKLRGLIEDFIVPPTVTSGFRSGGPVDELFIPDDDGDDEPSPGARR